MTDLRQRAERIAKEVSRKLRIFIHNLNPRETLLSPEQPDNKKWLDSVGKIDAEKIAPLLESEFAEVRSEAIEECAREADKLAALKDSGYERYAQECAAAIRKLGDCE